MIIAEIGNNHEGSYARAKEMIGLAADVGVDAVKFQTFCTEHYVSPENKARFNQLKSFELTFDEFERLKKVADNAGVIFLSTPFDIKSAEFLNSVVPAFKIASGDNSFYPLIETVARFGKPVLLSCGLASLTHLRYAQALLEGIWRDIGVKSEMAVLHCVTSSPVPPVEANLGAIRTLGKELGCVVGYSDHTLGIDAAALSIAVGARIVEKHFTMDKNLSEFRDHQLSADPQEMKILVERIRTIEELLGTGRKVPQKSEKKIESMVRRSIVAGRDLRAGEIVKNEDITWVRPAGGVPPGREELLLGKTLTQAVGKGEMLTPDMMK